MTPAQDDPHYKKHVTGLGDMREVVTSHDVYSSNGIKLLSAGARINSAMHERIISHKLNVPLEQCLTVGDPVSPACLAECAQGILDTRPLLKRMQHALPEKHSLIKVLGSVQLNAPLAFKLTVARDKMEELFYHSVETALICAFLGYRAGLDTHQLTQLTTAGVFHDLGELHIDPALLDRKRALNTDERKHFFAHPLTVFLMLKEFPVLYHPTISTAVLEHHERLDGSGYPRGATQENLGRLGRLLAVAEVVASMYRSGEDAELSRIEAVLKLNMRHQLDAGAIGHILAILEPGCGGVAARIDSLEKLHNTLRQMAEHFSAWDKDYQPQLKACSGNKRLAFLSERINMLKSSLEDTGFDFEHIDTIAETLDGGDDEALELQSLAQEFVWKIKNIDHELRRRWPMFEQTQNDAGDNLVHSWMKRTRQLVSA